MKKLIALSVLFASISACATGKQVARTANDAARIACEVMFGEEELPQGMSVEQFCAVHENVQPFLDQILAAKAGVQAGMTPEE